MVGIVNFQAIDDRVMLTRKQRVQGGKSNPPVPVDGGQFLERVMVGGFRIEWQMSGFVEILFAVG